MINRYFSYSLCPHNTFGVDVKTAQFVDFESENELQEIIAGGIEQPLLVIGGGSNLLFLNDFAGTVLHSAIHGIEVVEEDEDYVLLRVGSGIVWDDFVAYTVEKGWQGLENLSMIPGEVGASAVQNVGAYGVEAGELIERVETISLSDGSKRIFSHDECLYAYRSSIFKMEYKGKVVVSYVTFRLRKKPLYRLNYGNLQQMVDEVEEVTLMSIRNVVMNIRKAKLPDVATLGSAGSFFINPVVSAEHAANILKLYPDMPQYPTSDGKVKLSSAWLIDRSGWKGKRIGNVGTYIHQPLVIVNYGGATGREILDFANAIRLSVEELFGVTLIPEVNVIE